MKSSSVLIIGGGLCGLVAALDLASKGISVVLIEKKNYPLHKVCGEYVSMEVLDYVRKLGFDPFSVGAKKIDQFQLTDVQGRSFQAQLDLGGFGISRYCFDFSLYELAKQKGVQFILEDMVLSVSRDNVDCFTVKTQKGLIFQSKLVIGAFGKRSNMDKYLDRNFIKEKSPFLAYKAHYRGDFPDNLVALHNFSGGYCGLSKVETDRINLCYLCFDNRFHQHGSFETFHQNELSKNPFLAEVFQNWQMDFNQPLTISQIYFKPKQRIENGMIMLGDAAGLIYPLSGNGMGMAIHSAKIASDLIVEYLKNRISRVALEKQYSIQWQQQFNSRIQNGIFLQRFFGSTFWSSLALQTLKVFPKAGHYFISKSHGKAI